MKVKSSPKIIRVYCALVNEFHHKTHSPFIETILTYVNTDLSADLTLQTLAKHLNVNASYLSNLFSKEMKITLTEYVTQQRMNYAAKLLALSNTSIKSVAEQCGFQDIHYFSRIFKKNKGLSPKLFHETYFKADHDILTILNSKETK